MLPRIPHIPNKNAGMDDGLGQIALSAESCYQSITKLETVLSTKGFYNHDNIIMSH